MNFPWEFVFFSMEWDLLHLEGTAAFPTLVSERLIIMIAAIMKTNSFLVWYFFSPQRNCECAVYLRLHLMQHIFFSLPKDLALHRRWVDRSVIKVGGEKDVLENINYYSPPQFWIFNKNTRKCSMFLSKEKFTLKNVFHNIVFILFPVNVFVNTLFFFERAKNEVIRQLQKTKW